MGDGSSTAGAAFAESRNASAYRVGNNLLHGYEKVHQTEQALLQERSPRQHAQAQPLVSNKEERHIRMLLHHHHEGQQPEKKNEQRQQHSIEEGQSQVLAHEQRRASRVAHSRVRGTGSTAAVQSAPSAVLFVMPERGDAGATPIVRENSDKKGVVSRKPKTVPPLNEKPLPKSLLEHSFDATAASASEKKDSSEQRLTTRVGHENSMSERHFPVLYGEHTGDDSTAEDAIFLATNRAPQLTTAATLHASVHSGEPTKARLSSSAEKQGKSENSRYDNEAPRSVELENAELSGTAPAAKYTYKARSPSAAIAAAKKLLPPETAANLRATLELLKKQREIGGLLQRLWQQHIRVGWSMREILHEYLLSLEKDYYSQHGEAFLYDQAMKKTLMLQNRSETLHRAQSTEEDEILALLQDTASHRKRMHALQANLRSLPSAEKPQAVVEHIAAVERPVDIAGAIDAQAGSNVKPLLDLLGKDIKQERQSFGELLRLVRTVLKADPDQGAAAAENQEEKGLASALHEEDDLEEEGVEGETRREGGKKPADASERDRKGTKAGKEILESSAAASGGKVSTSGESTIQKPAANDRLIDKEQALELLDASLNPQAGPIGTVDADLLPLLSQEDMQYFADLDKAYEASRMPVMNINEEVNEKKHVTCAADLQKMTAAEGAAANSEEAIADKSEVESAAASALRSSSATGEGKHKEALRVLRRRAIAPWHPEETNFLEKGSASLIQLDSSSKKSQKEEVPLLQQLGVHEELAKHQNLRQQPVYPHVFSERAVEEAMFPVPRVLGAPHPLANSVVAKNQSVFSDPIAGDLSLLMAGEQRLAATKAVEKEAAAAKQSRLASDTTLLGRIPLFARKRVTFAVSGAEAKENNRRHFLEEKSLLPSTLAETATSAFTLHNRTPFSDTPQQPLTFAAPLSHLQEQVRQASPAGAEESNLDEESGIDVDTERESEEDTDTAGSEDEEKEEGMEKDKAAAAAEEEGEKDTTEKADSEKAKGDKGEKSAAKGEAAEKASGVSVRAGDESMMSDSEEAEESASFSKSFDASGNAEVESEKEDHAKAHEETKELKVSEKTFAESQEKEEQVDGKHKEEYAEGKQEKKEVKESKGFAATKQELEEEEGEKKPVKGEEEGTEEERAEQRTAEPKERRNETEGRPAGVKEEERERNKETLKKEGDGRYEASCTNIEDLQECVAEPRCFHDEVYHQCFFNCTALEQPDECTAHISCRYEKLLPRNACVNEGYQSTSISAQSFEGILRGCEEFRKKEACEMMAARSKQLKEKGVPVAYNCQWLDTLSQPPLSPSPLSALQLLGRNAAAISESAEEGEERKKGSSFGFHVEKKKENEEAAAKPPGNEGDEKDLPPGIGAASLCVNMEEVPTSEGLTVASVLAQKQQDLRDLEARRNVSVDQICPFPEELAANAKVQPTKSFYAAGDQIEVQCLPGYTLMGARRVIKCEGKSVFSPKVECILTENLSPNQLQHMRTIEKFANLTTEHPDLVGATVAAAAGNAAMAITLPPTGKETESECCGTR